jgi:AraC-like DNA-binding protein
MDTGTLELKIPRPARALFAGLFISPGNWRHRDDVRHDFEIILVRRGQLAIWEEDQKFVVNTNQTLLLWPDRKHGGLQVHDRRLSFYWLHFSMQSAGSGKGATICMLPQLGTPARPDRLQELFHRFLSDFGTSDDWKSGPLDDPRADLLLLQIIAEAAAQRDSEKSAHEPALAQNIRSYIDAHFFEPIGPADIVKSLRYSGVYLRQTFRHATGLTLSQAIQNRRMLEARRLLLETTLTLKEIAFRCGFDDEGYFCRVFRKHEGVNPTVFRNTRMKLPINVI